MKALSLIACIAIVVFAVLSVTSQRYRVASVDVAEEYAFQQAWASDQARRQEKEK